MKTPLINYIHSNTLLNALFPRRCVLCQEYSHSSLAICISCQSTLPYAKIGGCSSCALPLNHEQHEAQLCGQCQKTPTGASKAMACFYYTPPITTLIARLKFNGDLHCGLLLGELMAAQLDTYYNNQHRNKPCYIIPLPLHPVRLRQRGFNQSTVLAKPISRRLGIPIYHNAVTRRYNTASQSLLSAQKREKNMWHAFVAKAPPPANCVAIIDDVITTGSTIRAVSQTLLKSNTPPHEIHLWCCARTL